MKKIGQVFLYDISHIKKNVIAMIVVLGLCVVPSLYAWFNIAASWDPYSNTNGLKVAVANTDEGYEGEILPLQINIGDTVISSLIEGAKVFVNGKLITTNSYQLKENDVISVRGYGKFRYNGTGAKTKKNRIYVSVYKYI